MPKDGVGCSALRLVELPAKLKIKRLAVDTLVAQIELDTQIPEQGYHVRQAAAGDSQVAIKVFETSDDAWRSSDGQPHPLEFDKHRVGERRESPERVSERGGKLRSIDVDAVGQGRPDPLGQLSLAQSFSQRAWRAPWWVACTGGWAYREGSIRFAAGDEFSEAVRCDLGYRCEVGPLVAMGLEPVVEEFGVAAVAGRALQG